MRGAQPSWLWGRQTSCPPRDGFAVAVAAGVDRGQICAWLHLWMAEVGALGYNSLRRAWRIDLAGWAARSPSQAGSLTSRRLVSLPLEVREGAFRFAGERFLKAGDQSLIEGAARLDLLAGLELRHTQIKKRISVERPFPSAFL